MTLRLIEGFDTLGTGNYTVCGRLATYRNWVNTTSFETPSGIFAPGRYGTGRFYLVVWRGQGGWWRVIDPTGWSSVVCGFATAPSHAFAGLGAQFFNIRNASGTVNCGLSVDTGAQKVRLHNAAGTVVGTSTTAWVTGWNYYEVKLTVGVSGSATVRQNGVEVIAATTANYGTALAVGPQFWIQGDGYNWTYMGCDDVYFLDTSGPAPCNDFLGDVRVEAIWPTSDGANTDWTQDSGGNQFSRVADSGAGGPDDDTSYVVADTVGMKDTYGHGDISATNGVIYGLQHNLVAKKTDAGPRTLKSVLRHGGADTDGSVSHVLTANYTGFQQIWELNPATATNWLLADINSDEYGMKVVT